MKIVTLLHRNGDVTIRGAVAWIDTYSTVIPHTSRPYTHVLMSFAGGGLERFDDIDFVRVIPDR